MNMMNNDEIKTTPFWHEAAPPEPPSMAEAPEETDIAIAGSGYTGLNAARTLAKAGRRVTVFETGAPGAGASTRNGGMLGWGHRASVARLARAFGEDRARAMMTEARLSLDYTLDLIRSLDGVTNYAQTGRFLGAGSRKQFDGLARWAENEAGALGMEVKVVPKAEQQFHVGTELYHGGVYFPQHGALHPALFHQALLRATRLAGAKIVDHCPIAEISGGPGDWRIAHARGRTRARELVYAGNGYTGGSKGPFGEFARRLVPIPSYIVATEPLGSNRMGTLFPKGTCIVETRSHHSYFRPDPQGERILYGGRASLNVLDERRAARRLRDVMLSIFPDLNNAALTHSWKGFTGFTFDGVPHIGQVDGIWHACGYNGSGVAMAPYLGWRLAQKILGTDKSSTGFDFPPFQRQRFYGGNPWFLKAVEAWMRLRDWTDGVKRVPRN